MLKKGDKCFVRTARGDIREAKYHKPWSDTGKEHWVFIGRSCCLATKLPPEPGSHVFAEHVRFVATNKPSTGHWTK